MRIRDLDEVPEDPVVADPQRSDAGALALARLQRGEVGAGGAPGGAKVVEVGIRARVGWRRRRSRSPGRSSQSSASSVSRKPVGRAAALGRVGDLALARRSREPRPPVASSAAHASRTAPRSRGVAIRCTQRATSRSRSRIPPSASRRRRRPSRSSSSASIESRRLMICVDVGERILETGAQQAHAHRRPGGVEELQQRGAALAQAGEQLEVGAGVRIESHGAVRRCGSRCAAGPG